MVRTVPADCESYVCVSALGGAFVFLLFVGIMVFENHWVGENALELSLNVGAGALEGLLALSGLAYVWDGLKRGFALDNGADGDHLQVDAFD
jgi:hypothetical protein